MDTRIPLGVQSPDLANALMGGLQAGGMAQQAQQQNALRQLYATQGPQIMAGDANALGALARMDPMAAMGVQQNQLGMQHMRMQMDEIRSNASAKAAELAAKASADQVAAEIAHTKQIMMGAAPLYSAWKAGDQAAGQRLAQYLGSMGVQVTPDTMEQTIYAMQGGLDGLTAGLETLKMAQPSGAQWVPATPEQAAQYGAAAGQIDTSTGKFDPINPPSGGIQFDPETGRVLSIGGSGGAARTTEAQDKNAGFLIRMRDSGKVLDGLEAQGTDLGASLLAMDPTGMSNYMQTPEYQLYDQAKRDFVNAQLRRESGAVINPSEFANAERQYFPVPGDSPEVIAQKRKNRENAIAGVTVGAGPNAQNPIVAGSEGVTTGALDFKAMGLPQITAIDITTLNEDQKAALSARLKELGF